MTDRRRRSKIGAPEADGAPERELTGAELYDDGRCELARVMATRTEHGDLHLTAQVPAWLAMFANEDAAHLLHGAADALRELADYYGPNDPELGKPIPMRIVRDDGDDGA